MASLLHIQLFLNIFPKSGRGTQTYFTHHFSKWGVYVPLFWTELSCSCKSYLNKATLLLGWSHCYKNFTIVITIWLAFTIYPYLKWKWILYFLRRCFLSSITGGIRVAHIFSFLCCHIMCVFVLNSCLLTCRKCLISVICVRCA